MGRKGTKAKEESLNHYRLLKSGNLKGERPGAQGDILTSDSKKGNTGGWIKRDQSRAGEWKEEGLHF